MIKERREGDKAGRRGRIITKGESRWRKISNEDSKEDVEKDLRRRRKKREWRKEQEEKVE